MDTPQQTVLKILPQTKGQRLHRMKDAWEQLSQSAQTSTATLDGKRATLLAEALGEDTLDAGPVTEKDIAEAVGISQVHVGRLLHYYRFSLFVQSVNKPMGLLTIPERRFRAYWQQMHAPEMSRGKRTPEYREQYERRIFLSILEWVEAGKAPMDRTRPKPPKTVQQMLELKRPMHALHQEVERRLKTLEPMMLRARDFLGRDRATYAPDFMSRSLDDIERWNKDLIALLTEFFDRYND